MKNLIVHGVESKHYNKVDGNTVEPIAGSGYSLYANTWAIGNVFLDYILSTEDPTKHEQLRAYNDRAIDSMVNTFLPAEITEPKRKQRQMEIKNTISNYKKQLVLGAVDVDSTLAEFNEMLRKAGIEDELKDIEQEYAEFMKSK